MTSKTIFIDESNKNVKAFLSYLKSIYFVRIKENEEVNIPQSQINETPRRISLINSSEIAIKSWH